MSRILSSTTLMTSILLLLPLISWVCSQDTTFTIVDDVPDINSIQSPDAANDVTVTIDATDDVTTTQDTTSASRDKTVSERDPNFDIRVTLDSGIIRGYRNFLDQETYTTRFLGVPYAAPPVGNLRFKGTRRPVEWSGIRDAISYRAACPQPEGLIHEVQEGGGYGAPQAEYDEDCLTANIYVPGDIIRGVGVNLLPVMVYIHGGVYVSGAGSMPMFNGDQLALTGELIVVTFNYRLGVLGFLSTGDLHAPGNAGLLDQVSLLEWVQRNIGQFGGDLRKVTLFGQGSGAACVSYHSVSPLSEGLFHRVIGQSGVTAGGVSKAENQLELTRELARSLNCNKLTSAAILDCLRKLPYQKLLDAAEDNFPVAVIEDGKFLPTSPRDLWEEGKFHKIPYLIGSTSDDGTMFLPGAGLNMDILDEGLEPRHVTDMVNLVMEISEYPINAQIIRDAITYEYFPIADDKFYNIRASIDMFTDFAFLSPDTVVSNLIAKFGGQIYNYHFSYRPPFSVFSDVIELGAGHGQELPFVFGSVTPGGALFSNVSDDDISLSYSMMATWAQFAHHGVPAFLNSEFVPLEFPLYDNHSRSYVDFRPSMSQDNILVHLRTQRMVFWNKFIADIGYLPYIQPEVLENTQEEGMTPLSKVHTEVIMILLATAAVILLLGITIVSCMYKHKEPVTSSRHRTHTKNSSRTG